MHEANAPHPVVEARGLVKHFGRGAKRVDAVRGLDVDLPPGQVLGLLGANGSGKSTTLRMILGLLPASSGTLHVLGAPAGTRSARQRTGYVPEEARRFGRLSGRETVDLFARLQGVRGRAERKQRVREALSDVGLAEAAWDQRVEGYSRGMARRLAMATAWVHRPALLVLDEPTSGLDPIGKLELLSVLKRHREAGGSAIVSTHDRQTASEACDHLLVLHAGKRAFDGTPADLLRDDGTASLLPLIERARDA